MKNLQSVFPVSFSWRTQGLVLFMFAILEPGTIGIQGKFVTWALIIERDCVSPMFFLG